MYKDLEEKLFSIEPAWFNKEDPKESLMCFGFDCGDGWFDIVKSILAIASNMLDNDRKSLWWTNPDTGEREKKSTPYAGESPFEPGKFEVIQVKEKFGGLRFYYNGGNEEFDGVVRMAEAMSYFTCESCGNKGTIRNTGWMQTLCDLHAVKDKPPYQKTEAYKKIVQDKNEK